MLSRFIKTFIVFLLFYSQNSFAQQNGNILVFKNPKSSVNELTSHPLISFLKNVSGITRLSIVNPTNNSVFNAGSSISIYLEITNPVHIITHIAFYNDGIQFYKDSSSAFSFTKIDAEPGDYHVSAKAFFNTGDSITSDTVHITVIGCVANGAISAAGYTNIPGPYISDLTRSSKYPDNPDVVSQLSMFEYGPDYGDNYGARVRGFICAPATGDYVFYIASDDQAGLWLSTDDNPGNKVLIAYNESHVGFREWYKHSSQKSLPVKLIKGVRYYIETLHKQKVGPNNLSVAWQIPDGMFEAPIPGKRLSTFDSGLTNNVVLKNFNDAMRKPTTGKFLVNAVPNPTINYFTLTIHSTSSESISLKVTDMFGKIVEKRKNFPATLVVKFGNELLPGMYMVEVQQGQEKKIMKVIKY